MSGSGGGGGSGGDDGWRPTPRPGGGGGDGGGGDTDPCYIVETTNLNSVDRTVIAGLAVGDRLPLRYDPGPPQRLLATTAAGAIAGSITSPSMPQLIRCMSDGRDYVAIVIVIRGAQVQVRIEPA